MKRNLMLLVLLFSSSALMACDRHRPHEPGHFESPFHLRQGGDVKGDN